MNWDIHLELGKRCWLMICAGYLSLSRIKYVTAFSNAELHHGVGHGCAAQPWAIGLSPSLVVTVIFPLNNRSMILYTEGVW